MLWLQRIRNARRNDEEDTKLVQEMPSTTECQLPLPPFPNSREMHDALDKSSQPKQLWRGPLLGSSSESGVESGESGRVIDDASQ